MNVRCIVANGSNPIHTIERGSVGSTFHHTNDDNDLVTVITATGTVGENKGSGIVSVTGLVGTAAAAGIRSVSHLERIGLERKQEGLLGLGWL